MAIVDGHIRCSVCGATKPLQEYAPCMVSAGNGCCRSCRRSKYKAPLTRETQRKYNLRKYGLSVEDYDRLLDAQGGGCASCGATGNRDGRKLYVDHCHETGAVRGLLCYGCNTGIGALGDSAAGVRRALNYLEPAQDKPLLTFAF